MVHHLPLYCRHGCVKAIPHKCQQQGFKTCDGCETPLACTGRQRCALQ
jgi:hypothetical protein